MILVEYLYHTEHFAAIKLMPMQASNCAFTWICNDFAEEEATQECLAVSAMCFIVHDLAHFSMALYLIDPCNQTPKACAVLRLQHSNAFDFSHELI